ncbi:hypothetical protein FML33_25420 [Klebsiella oxytoca]|nr:hypothetical protein CUC51_24525 [Citrobacter freundii]MBZ7729618.1 hypothetical protein [Klebsiella oxytoca]
MNICYLPATNISSDLCLTVLLLEKKQSSSPYSPRDLNNALFIVNATIFDRYLPFSCPLRYFRY